MATVIQVMKKDYPSAVDTFMFKPVANIAAIMGITATTGGGGAATIPVDFTTFTASLPTTGTLALTTTRVKFDSYVIDERIFTIKDYGANYFGNTFRHRFKYNFTKATIADPLSNYGGTAILYGLSNTFNPTWIGMSTDDVGFAFAHVNRTSGGYYSKYLLQAFKFNQFEQYPYFVPASNLPATPFVHYIQLDRVEPNLMRFHIFTDKNYTNELASVYRHIESSAFRYLIVAGGLDYGHVGSSTDTITGYVASMNVGGVPATIPSVTYNTLDLTSYSTTDQSGNLTVAATSIKISDMNASVVSYVVNNYGASAIGDCSFKYRVHVGTMTNTTPQLLIHWALTKTANYTASAIGNNAAGIYHAIYYAGANVLTFVYDAESNLSKNRSLTSLGLTIPFDLWCVARRRGKNCIFDMYTDENYTNWIEGQTLNGLSPGKYQYHVAMSSHENGKPNVFSGYISDYQASFNGLYAVATGLQDFTTYTLSVPATAITVANATTVNVASMNEPSNQFMYKDYGQNAFAGDFDLRWKSHFKLGAGVVSNIVTGITSTATVGYNVQDYLDENKGLFMQYRFSSVRQLQLYDAETDINSLVTGISADPRWFEMSRVGTRLTLNWYTDAYSTLEASTSIRCNTRSFGIISHAGSRQQAGSDKLSYDIMNFHIKET